MLSHVDDATERVNLTRRGFDAAFQRMCTASTVEEAEDELHTLLSQFYRLAEVAKNSMGGTRFYKALDSSDRLRAARALLWVRTFDAHAGVVVADLSGKPFSSYFTEMFGVLVWKPLGELPEQIDRHGHGRHELYARLLAGRPVLDSSRSIFDDVAALV
jgi:hypothetical protein